MHHLSFLTLRNANEVIQRRADQIKRIVLVLLIIIQQARHEETHLEWVDQTVQSEGDRDQ